ncbi:Isotrichodermin C-15 hydroxylase 4 [Phlyctema vagabunda]|uniref:Isotrichodermin C-15 hydroxylase 4 n=1 Tax=Phlyctema vagabunda TaxID=108571 RepID=A0ABR4P3H8_9HELO
MFARLTLLAISSAFIWIVAKCIYNVFFHPLRKYPGPLLAGATRAYNLYWDVQGLSHWKAKELHEKYGEAVRIAPDELSYTNGEAWPTIYGFANKDGTGNFEKDAQWWNKTISGVENILTADDAAHRRMRRLQNPAFSERALKAQESVIAGYTSLLIKQLHGQASSPDTAIVDIVAWYSFITFDAIGDLAFGEPFYCLRDAKWHWWISAIFDIFQAGTYLRAARRFPAPFFQMLLLFIPKRLLKTRHTQFQFSVDRVNKRLEKDSERPDFMSFIVEANEEKGMSVEEMYVASQVLISAGSETTATALVGATYLLLENPETFEQLKTEVRERFQEEKEITIQSTKELPYLNAVLEETLRLCPPGPGTFPRTVPMPGKMVCGQFVPGGYSVGVHQLSTNRSPLNFTEPESFRPERWLGNARFKDDKKSAMQPFSFGPRNCIGKNLAMAELRIIISRVIWNFDMKLPSESSGWLDRQKMYTTWKKDELKVELSSRL